MCNPKINDAICKIQDLRAYIRHFKYTVAGRRALSGRQRSREFVFRRRRDGLCVDCGNQVSEGFWRCEYHRELAAKRNREYYERKRMCIQEGC